MDAKSKQKKAHHQVFTDRVQKRVQATASVAPNGNDQRTKQDSDKRSQILGKRQFEPASKRTM